MVLNLFGTVAHFVFFESLHGLLLCGTPLLGHNSVALHLKKKVSTFESALFAQWLPWSPKKKKILISGRAIFALISEKKGQQIGVPDFCHSSNCLHITEIGLFWTKQPSSRKALWPTAKSPMVHWWVGCCWRPDLYRFCWTVSWYCSLISRS